MFVIVRENQTKCEEGETEFQRQYFMEMRIYFKFIPFLVQV